MFGWDVTMVLLDIVVIDVSYILNSNVADDFFLFENSILLWYAL